MGIMEELNLSEDYRETITFYRITIKSIFQTQHKNNVIFAA